jgi:glycosyltransferase involved in cell wall biosynthesis
MYHKKIVTAVIPALNEEAAIGKVVNDLLMLISTNENNVIDHVIDHVIVCDNGSTDATASVAQKAGATVVKQPIAGYGIACLTAIAALPQCDIVLFIDGDNASIIEQALPLIDGISRGADLTIGSRPLGNIEPGALTMPQLFGNWLSAKLIYLFWGKKVTDLGPFRAINKTALNQLNMQDKAFGWTVEMQVKAIIHRMKINEYPVDSKVRIGTSKISGTILGSIKAGIGILSMIAKLRLTQTKILTENNKSCLKKTS